MTAKEIYALRKEGLLDEAYAEAKKALAINAGDPWMIKALAWVLHDKIKLEIKTGHPTTSILLEEFNALPIGEDDEILLKQKAYLNQQADPLKIQAHALAIQSKEGHHEEALNGFRQLRQGNSDNHHIDSDYAWALFRCLYHLPSEQQKPQVIGELLREYARLTIEKPDLLHSCMLKAALHQAEHYDKLIEFILWWNPDYLRPEDYETEKDDQGNEYPSLYVRMIRAIGKSLKKRNELKSDIRTKLLSLFEAAIKQCPDEEWFPYYHGQLLIRAGNRDQAHKELMSLIKLKQRNFWAWDLLAHLAESPEDQCACLCKALLCRVPDEGFLVNVHLELGECLQQLGMPEDARREVECVLRIRREKGWNISRDVQQLAGKLQASQDPAAGQPNEVLYHRYEHRAMELLFGDEPSVLGVVTRVNKQKGLSCIQFGKERTDFTLAYHDKFPEVASLREEGHVFSMKLIHDEGKQRYFLLTLVSSQETPNSTFYKTIEGTVRKSESQSFAFLGDIFIAPPLVSTHHLENGQSIKANAIREWNDRKNTFSWRVIALNSCWNEKCQR